MMQIYDPLKAPDPADWLALAESDRLSLVYDYHLDSETDIPNPNPHAAIHVIVENQLALHDQIVVETLARLTRQGLDRHDAIHAIGAVLAEHMYAFLSEERKAPTNQAYYSRLRKLTAKRWLKGKW
ncbi:MAG: DUF1841 family protein [Gammaproteobacteria bacterium]